MLLLNKQDEGSCSTTGHMSHQTKILTSQLFLEDASDSSYNNFGRSYIKMKKANLTEVEPATEFRILLLPDIAGEEIQICCCWKKYIT